jgi:hypothetical protein
MANIAVGAIPPLPGYGPAPADNSVQTTLQSMMESMKKLADRLAAPVAMIPIVFNNVPAGISVSPVTIPSGGFNGIMMALTTGVVDVYLGASSTGPIPDFTLTGKDNPVYIPLPPQSVNQISLKVDPNSPANANGTIFLFQY